MQVQSLSLSFAFVRPSEELETSEELKDKRIIRILMNDFPQYLAIVSRLRQETALVGSDGGVLSSTVVQTVQAVFPEGALQKRIRVGLQVCTGGGDALEFCFCACISRTFWRESLKIYDFTIVLLMVER